MRRLPLVLLLLAPLLAAGHNPYGFSAWDDALVAATATTAYGARPPRFGLVKNSGAAGAGFALRFNAGAASTGAANNDFGDFAADYSVCFWLVTTSVLSGTRYAVFKGSSFSFAVVGGRMVFGIQGFSNLQSVASVNGGGRTMICGVADEDGLGNTTEYLYVNGVLNATQIIASNLPADTANVVNLGWNGAAASSRLTATLDEVRFYGVALTASQVAEYWAAGAGTTNEVTGAAVIVGWHMDEGAGVALDNYEGTANYDATVANISWVTGLTASAATRGVYSWIFPPGEETELWTSAQLPHSYKVGTALHPHVHWAPTATTVCNVQWGIEYTAVGIAGTLGNTTTLTVKQAAGGTAYAHNLAEPVATIAGAGLTISSILLARIYRDGDDAANDTCTAMDAVLLGFDYHLETDGNGSRQETVK